MVSRSISTVAANSTTNPSSSNEVVSENDSNFELVEVGEVDHRHHSKTTNSKITSKIFF